MNHTPIRRRGIGSGTILLVIVVIASIGTVGWFLRSNDNAPSDSGGADLFTVKEGSFDISIPASGELAALRKTDIASQLDARAVITWIVDEGTQVKKGDVLIELDAADIETQIKDVEVAVKSAETAFTTATTNLTIKQDANRSELDLADVDIKLAQLAFDAWASAGGQNESKEKELANEVETTKKNYERLTERVAKSRELARDDFISKDELEREEIELMRARSAYEQADRARSVYLNYTREQDKAKLEADLKRATDTRKETADRNENELRRLETEVETKQLALERERERLEKVRRQLTMCTIKAPQDGLVVYASSLDRGGRGNDDSPPEIGTELRRNRTVMILPDTSHMIAEVKVNEALTGRIRKGQRAAVTSDAVQNVSMPGEVLDVGVLAESGGWRDPNRRDYTVRIDLGPENQVALKPSMRCKANIVVGRVEDATFVPVQSIFREGPVAFVYVPENGGFVPKPVSIGRTSELYIEITAGLQSGDEVLLREPTAGELRGELDPDIVAAANTQRRSGRPSGGGRPPAAAAASDAPGKPAAADRPTGTTTGRPARTTG